MATEPSVRDYEMEIRVLLDVIRRLEANIAGRCSRGKDAHDKRTKQLADAGVRSIDEAFEQLALCRQRSEQPPAVDAVDPHLESEGKLTTRA